MNKKKFNFREIVTVETPEVDAKEANGKKGYIISMSDNEKELESNSYGVFIFELKEVWGFEERELVSTHEFVPEGYGNSNTTITVSQKGEITAIKNTKTTNEKK